jgi:hypothetical protein
MHLYLLALTMAFIYMSNEQIIPWDENAPWGYWGLEDIQFSPNGRFLYVGYIAKNIYTDIFYPSYVPYLLQYDLHSSNIASSGDTIAIGNLHPDVNNVAEYGFTSGFVAPDGKIYYNGGSRTFHTIEFPDRKGAACGFRANNQNLNGAEMTGEFPTFPNFRLGPIDGSPCDSLGIDNKPMCLWRWDIEDTTAILERTFTDFSAYEPTSWHWDFGDGAMSQDTSPVHIFPQPGIYNVCLIVCNAHACDTLCREVNVGVSDIDETTNTQANQLTIYPNPAQDYLTLLIPHQNNPSTKGTWLAYAINGQEKATGTLSGAETKISTQTWADGVYVMYVTVDGVRSVAKVVVSRF